MVAWFLTLGQNILAVGICGKSPLLHGRQEAESKTGSTNKTKGLANAHL